jgi:hypothetical protein
MVHHLVQQLIGDDEVVPQGLIFQLLEVADEDITNLVKECQYHCYIRVALSHTDHVNIVHLDPNIGRVLFGENWFDESLIKFKNLSLELISNTGRALTSVIP